MINWQQVETVFLDMDGTLLDLYFDNYFWQEFVPTQYAEEKGITHQKAHEILADKYKSVEGTMDWYCVDYWTEQLGLDIEGLKREVSHYIAVHPHVHDFLKELGASGRHLFLVTNAHQKSLSLKMEKTELGGYFDQIICSHDYGIPKDDPSFWGALREKFHFNPEKTLLVEDSLSVLHSAKTYGIGHLLAITRPDSRQDERVIDEFPAVASFEGFVIQED